MEEAQRWLHPHALRRRLQTVVEPLAVVQIVDSDSIRLVDHNLQWNSARTCSISPVVWTVKKRNDTSVSFSICTSLELSCG